MSEQVLEELIELSAEAEEAHEEFLALSEKGKAAKKRWEALTLRIQSRLKACRETHPLFGRDDDDPDDDSGGDDGPDGPIGPVTPGDGDVIDVEFTDRPALPAPPGGFYQPVPAGLQSESWRDDPIEMLVDHGLTDKTLGLMDEAAIRTIGALADWSNAGKRLVDIPGIGEARATEIEEAMDLYWAAWSQKQAEVSATDRPRRKKKTA